MVTVDTGSYSDEHQRSGKYKPRPIVSNLLISRLAVSVATHVQILLSKNKKKRV
jgi:hypothetical protein